MFAHPPILPPPPPRLVLLPNCYDTEGEPRIAVLPAGARAVPVAYPSIAAALAALRVLVVQGGRP